MAICKSCNSSYDENNTSVPQPIPDYMCADCGTQLTKEQVDLIISENVLNANT